MVDGRFKDLPGNPTPLDTTAARLVFAAARYDLCRCRWVSADFDRARGNATVREQRDAFPSCVFASILERSVVDGIDLVTEMTVPTLPLLGFVEVFPSVVCPERCVVPRTLPYVRRGDAIIAGGRRWLLPPGRRSLRSVSSVLQPDPTLGFAVFRLAGTRPTEVDLDRGGIPQQRGSYPPKYSPHR
jgi:hypothetical protein